MLLCLLALLWLPVSCEFLQNDPVLTIDAEDGWITFDAEGGDSTILITSNCDWEAESLGSSTGESFFSVSPRSGKPGESVLTVHVLPQQVVWPRGGSLALKYRKTYVSPVETRELYVNVYQKGAAEKIWFGDWQEPTLPAEGGSFTTNLFYNGQTWWVTCDDPDVKLDFAWKQHDNDPIKTVTVTVSVAANPSTEKRSFTLKVSDRREQNFYGNYVFHQQAGTAAGV